MKKRIIAVLVALVTMMGLFVVTAGPASAENNSYDCTYLGGDSYYAKFCLRIRWRYRDGEVLVLDSRVYMKSDKSNIALGYQGMDDITTERIDVYHNSVHSHDNAATSTREWVDAHNTQRNWLHVWIRFDVKWAWAHDSDNVQLGIHLN